jgi:hypothetical protein
MITSGSIVKGGFYFNRDQLDLVVVSGKEGVLPGADGQRCYRVHLLAVLFLAPLFGGLFMVLVPLVGLIMLARRLGLFSIIGRAASGLLRVVALARRLGKAHVADKEQD